jgi:hypothetical protein
MIFRGRRSEMAETEIPAPAAIFFRLPIAAA